VTYQSMKKHKKSSKSTVIQIRDKVKGKEGSLVQGRTQNFFRGCPNFLFLCYSHGFVLAGYFNSTRMISYQIRASEFLFKKIFFRKNFPF